MGRHVLYVEVWAASNDGRGSARCCCILPDLAEVFCHVAAGWDQSLPADVCWIFDKGLTVTHQIGCKSKLTVLKIDVSNFKASSKNVFQAHTPGGLIPDTHASHVCHMTLVRDPAIQRGGKSGNAVTYQQTAGLWVSARCKCLFSSNNSARE
jgi:hypothetical protein